MSDQVIVNVNSVTHRGAAGDTHSSTNVVDNAANNGTDETSDRHGHAGPDNHGQMIVDLDIQRMAFMMLLVAILLPLIAFVVTVNLPDPSTVPINLLKAIQVTSRVLYFYGAFLLFLVLCRTKEASVSCAIYQWTFLWASVPLAAVVVGLKVAISIISQLHQ